MKITKPLIIIGYSAGIIIDKKLVKKMQLKKGDLVEADIKKVE